MTSPSCTFSTPEVASPECSTISEVGPLIPTVPVNPAPPVLPVTGGGADALALGGVLLVVGCLLLVSRKVREVSRKGPHRD